MSMKLRKLNEMKLRRKRKRFKTYLLSDKGTRKKLKVGRKKKSKIEGKKKPKAKKVKKVDKKDDLKKLHKSTIPILRSGDSDHARITRKVAYASKKCRAIYTGMRD